MEVVTTVCLAALGVAALLCTVRVVKGPSLADRVVGLDTLVLVLLCAVGVATARWQTSFFVTVMLVGSLVGFTGTVTVARFIERRGAR